MIGRSIYCRLLQACSSPREIAPFVQYLESPALHFADASPEVASSERSLRQGIPRRSAEQARRAMS